MNSDDLPLFSPPSLPPQRSATPASNVPADGAFEVNPDTATATHGRQMSADAGVSVGKAEAMSVSELNRRVKNLLEARLPLGWVRGELSNVVRAASGHWYFSLKDDAAQVRCVMFRARAQSVTFTPANGIEVEVRALPTLYEARGDFQLGVETMRRAGHGALFDAFERLKRTLAAEGLFDSAQKRELPSFPANIGIVTSTRGAALHDVLTTLRRRAPMINVIIYPTAVQGADAPGEITAAINAARVRAEIDALLICRGGGSMEDLWAFNAENVARAIYQLQRETSIVVVSGIGHETDFTICDFVADARAPTPTAGAEMCSPDRDALFATVALQRQQLQRAMRRQLGHCQQRLDMAARSLVSPQQRLARARERIASQRTQLQRAMALLLQRNNEQRSRAASTLSRTIAQHIQQQQQWLAQCRQALQLLSPDRVLTRGYAIVQKSDGSVVAHVGDGAMDESIHIRLQDGELRANISAVSAITTRR